MGKEIIKNHDNDTAADGTKIFFMNLKELVSILTIIAPIILLFSQGLDYVLNLQTMDSYGIRKITGFYEFNINNVLNYTLQFAVLMLFTFIKTKFKFKNLKEKICIFFVYASFALYLTFCCSVIYNMSTNILIDLLTSFLINFLLSWFILKIVTVEFYLFFKFLKEEFFNISFILKNLKRVILLIITILLSLVFVCSIMNFVSNYFLKNNQYYLTTNGDYFDQKSNVKNLIIYENSQYYVVVFGQYDESSNKYEFEYGKYKLISKNDVNVEYHRFNQINKIV